MRSFARRRPWIVAALAGILLAASMLFALTRGEDLRTRLARVSDGMSRQDVEAILGRPEVVLPFSKPATGQVLLWVDQLWQVEVRMDRNGKVTSTKWTRSQSLYWRTLGRLIDLPK
jgi:hypothetical protein